MSSVVHVVIMSAALGEPKRSQKQQFDGSYLLEFAWPCGCVALSSARDSIHQAAIADFCSDHYDAGRDWRRH